MRLAGSDDGTVFGTSNSDIITAELGSGEQRRRNNWCQYETVPETAFRCCGSLPTLTGPAKLSNLASGVTGQLLNLLVGKIPTATVHRLEDGTWLATVSSSLWRSVDGRGWELCRRLPASSGPMGILPSALCEHDGTVFVGEYPLGDDTPRVIASPDSGRTWNTVLRLPDVRHVHAIQSDPYSNQLWVTTGDTDGECRISRIGGNSEDRSLSVVGGGAQAWRAVELAFTPEAILWGVDCGYAPTNRLYRLERNKLEEESPDPTVVGGTDRSVYYSATLTIGGETVVALSTAVETGVDRTAPERPTTGKPVARVLVASSASDYTEWRELISFQRRRRVTDNFSRLPSANTYVFLDADSQSGFLINPVNTQRFDGELLRVPPSSLRSDLQTDMT